jgi:hypothetical protein
MSMHLVGPYLTTTNYKSKKKKQNKKQQQANIEHDKWLKKMGLDSTQKELKKAATGKYKVSLPDYKFKENAPLSNKIDANGIKRGIMESLHKESPEVQAKILEKANRIEVAYNKGPAMYITPETDTTMLGSRSRRG